MQRETAKVDGRRLQQVQSQLIHAISELGDMFKAFFYIYPE